MGTATLEDTIQNPEVIAEKKRRVRAELQSLFNQCLKGKNATATAELLAVAEGAGLDKKELTTHEAIAVKQVSDEPTEEIQPALGVPDVQVLATMDAQTLDGALDESLQGVNVLPQGREVFKRLMARLLEVAQDDSKIVDPAIFEYLRSVIKSVRRILADNTITGDESVELAKMDSDVSQMGANKIAVKPGTFEKIKKI